MYFRTLQVEEQAGNIAHANNVSSVNDIVLWQRDHPHRNQSWATANEKKPITYSLRDVLVLVERTVGNTIAARTQIHFQDSAMLLVFASDADYQFMAGRCVYDVLHMTAEDLETRKWDDSVPVCSKNDCLKFHTSQAIQLVRDLNKEVDVETCIEPIYTPGGRKSKRVKILDPIDHPYAKRIFNDAEATLRERATMHVGKESIEVHLGTSRYMFTWSKHAPRNQSPKPLNASQVLFRPEQRDIAFVW